MQSLESTTLGGGIFVGRSSGTGGGSENKSTVKELKNPFNIVFDAEEFVAAVANTAEQIAERFCGIEVADVSCDKNKGLPVPSSLAFRVGDSAQSIFSHARRIDYALSRINSLLP